MKNLQNKGISFTSRDIASGSLLELLPELYFLKNVTEKNPWHRDQTVFDHTVSVIAALEKIVVFDFLYTDSRIKILELLRQERGGSSKLDISVCVALFHDIGKKLTIVTDPSTGQTQCPEHERVGAELAREYMARIGIGKYVIQQVSSVIARHNEIHEMVNRILMYNESEKEGAIFQKKVKDAYILHLIQGYADTVGSDLRTLNPAEYKKRELIFKEAINRFSASL